MEMGAALKTSICQVGSDTIEYATAGSSGPALVLINGSGGPLMAWSRVMEALSGEARVLAYNRAGIGKSSKPDKPQTAGFCADQLVDLLQALEIPHPWHVVGHSFGGLIANLLARRHPDKIRTMMFLEAAAPEDIRANAMPKPRLLSALQAVLDRIIPVDALGERKTSAQSLREVENAGPFPAVPVTVISGGKQPPRFLLGADGMQMRRQGQAALAALGSPGKHVVASGSGHFPQFSQPDLVMDEIRSLIREYP